MDRPGVNEKQAALIEKAIRAAEEMEDESRTLRYRLANCRTAVLCGLPIDRHLDWVTHTHLVMMCHMDAIDEARMALNYEALEALSQRTVR